MELLEGGSSSEAQERARPNTRDDLLQILDALKTAHDVGEGQSVLHLDLKPKNVFVLRGRPGDRRGSR
jgi:serine/threonine protein kinase